MNPYYLRNPRLKMAVPFVPFGGQKFLTLLISGFTEKPWHPAG